MRILAAPTEVDLVVQKSRFLGLLVPVTDPEAARAELKAAKGRYEDATHVVHAFRTGREGSEMYGCSDDGEPPGTAGRPALEVLKGTGGGDALLLIVRWFGGTKLGTGGLVKAYGDTAKAVIAAARWEVRRAWVSVTTAADWTEHRLLVAELTAWEAELVEEQFGDGVTLTVRLPEERLAGFQARTVDLTRGRRRWTVPGS